MHSNTKVNVNWFNVNVPTILAIAGLGWGIASYIIELRTKVLELESYRVSRAVSTDQKFGELQKELDLLSNVPFRMNAVETQLLSTNARLDRLVENLSGSVEALRKEVNAVGTKVEVLSSKIDSLGPQSPSRASIRAAPDAASLDNTFQLQPRAAQ